MRACKGQAILYALVALLAGALSIIFLFNSGQLTKEKIVLATAADAAAYSLSLMEARAMNYTAYTNRAIVANEVAIGQLVSMASWAQHVINESNYYPMYISDVMYKFPWFQASYTAAYYEGKVLDWTLSKSSKDPFETAAKASDKGMQLLAGTQGAVFVGLAALESKFAQEVADANAQDIGGGVNVTVKPGLLPGQAPVEQYKNDSRQRMTDVVRESAFKDAFLKNRTFGFSAIWGLSGCWYIPDVILRGGGTEMFGIDTWRSADTMSYWRSFTTKWGCGVSEDRMAYGARGADGSDLGGANYPLAGTAAINPTSLGLAMVTSKEWSLKGMPSFYELDKEALDKGLGKVNSRVVVYVSHAKSKVQTTDGTSAIKPQGRLQTFGAPAGNEYASLSVGETYFERPQARADGKKELSSLFNPYWRNRLVLPNATERAVAAANQGAVALP